jgi:hypothetical protein
VFTLPRELAPLALQNKRLMDGLLFRASAATLLEVARDPRHLGAEIGFFSVLHTWDRRLQHHPHVHCLIAAGGLAPDRAGWVFSQRSFFLPVKVLGRVFRGKFVAGMKAKFQEGKPPRRLNDLPNHQFFRSARTAVERCTSSNGSRRPNCWFVPHRSQTGMSHEPPTPASNRLRATASLPVLRLKRSSR